jgi:hypothetical protein
MDEIIIAPPLGSALYEPPLYAVAEDDDEEEGGNDEKQLSLSPLLFDVSVAEFRELLGALTEAHSNLTKVCHGLSDAGRPATHESMIRIVFTALDKDNNKTIDRAELARGLVMLSSGTEDEDEEVGARHVDEVLLAIRQQQERQAGAAYKKSSSSASSETREGDTPVFQDMDIVMFERFLISFLQFQFYRCLEPFVSNRPLLLALGGRDLSALSAAHEAAARLARSELAAAAAARDAATEEVVAARAEKEEAVAQAEAMRRRAEAAEAALAVVEEESKGAANTKSPRAIISKDNSSSKSVNFSFGSHVVENRSHHFKPPKTATISKEEEGEERLSAAAIEEKQLANAEGALQTVRGLESKVASLQEALATLRKENEEKKGGDGATKKLTSRRRSSSSSSSSSSSHQKAAPTDELGRALARAKKTEEELSRLRQHLESRGEAAATAVSKEIGALRSALDDSRQALSTKNNELLIAMAAIRGFAAERKRRGKEGGESSSSSNNNAPSSPQGDGDAARAALGLEPRKG